MYGYATDETSEYLPQGIVLAHKLTSGLQKLREGKTIPWLKPDGKAQVTINNESVETVLVSCQHNTTVSQKEMGVLGFRLGDLAYICDIHHYEERVFEVLSGIKTLVIDALKEEKSIEINASCCMSNRFSYILKKCLDPYDFRAVVFKKCSHSRNPIKKVFSRDS